jgi:hypothetical protein
LTATDAAKKKHEGVLKVRAASGVCFLLALLILQFFPACSAPGAGPRRDAVLRSLDLSLEWLTANPPDPVSASIGEVALDAWPWTIFSRLHPDGKTRTKGASEARKRLLGLVPEVEPTMVALSYWALLLRNLEFHNLDTSKHREALSHVDIENVLKAGNPTTNLWITELLSHSGLKVDTQVSESYLVKSAAAGMDSFRPTVKGAYALYHEIAPATDLGREGIRIFSEAHLGFARRILPELFEVSLKAGDTDAVAEVLITASLLGERKQRYFDEGIEWLLLQQRADGTYGEAKESDVKRAAVHYRHRILVVSWALLESLRD